VHVESPVTDRQMEETMPGGNYWTRTRVGRRAALRGAALGVVGLGGAALIGCGGDEEVAAPTAGQGGGGTPGAAGAGAVDPSKPGAAYVDAQPHLAATDTGPQYANAKRGGVYQFDQGDEPITLDNHKEETPGSIVAANLVYEQLLERWENFEEEPGRVFTGAKLAASWEQTDELTYVFTLQQGVTWQDVDPVNGRAFTSEDVKYSLERMIGDDPRLRTRNALRAIESVDTPDDQTAVVKTSFPYASLLNNIGHTWSVIVPPELGETDAIESKAVGTGAFILKDWQRGVALDYVRNPDYWQPGKPFLDGFRFRIVPDNAARLANFRTGETKEWGSSYGSTPVQTIQDVIDSLGDKVRNSEKRSTGSTTKVAFDVKNSVFKDERLRQAILFGFPYQKVIDGIFKGLASRQSMFSPLNVEWAPKEEDLPPEDPKKAAELMAAAGYGPDKPLKAKTQVSQFYSGPVVSQILQQMIKPLGFEIEIQIMENAQWIAEVYRGGAPWEMSSHGDWSWEDPDRGLFSYFHSEGAANQTHYSNSEVDRLLEKQRGIFDHEERYEVVQQIVQQILIDAPQVWLISPGAVELVRNEFVNFRGMMHGNSNEYRQYRNVWLDPEKA
jgi:peptide/nickel transport system substrate-binding protein